MLTVSSDFEHRVLEVPSPKLSTWSPNHLGRRISDDVMDERRRIFSINYFKGIPF
ncbi:hypothetical protein Syun_006593 [Stephania yunnanensis]|uniref:Uncharacterized protein n=1 Tax=Stephania yunnanensis TaxID=152371 RepID=A0AAP0PXP9_9MAGN